MLIYITRDSTSSIHAGGLERLRVWFQRPTYHYAVNQFEDLPFGNDMEGIGEWGWTCERQNHKLPETCISFGKLFGYGETQHPNHVAGLSEFVWSQLNKHYGNTEFVNGWYEYEKAGHCKQHQFLLEIDLHITFTPNT